MHYGNSLTVGSYALALPRDYRQLKSMRIPTSNVGDDTRIPTRFAMNAAQVHDVLAEMGRAPSLVIADYSRIAKIEEAATPELASLRTVPMICIFGIGGMEPLDPPRLKVVATIGLDLVDNPVFPAVMTAALRMLRDYPEQYYRPEFLAPQVHAIMTDPKRPLTLAERPVVDTAEL